MYNITIMAKKIKKKILNKKVKSKPKLAKKIVKKILPKPTKTKKITGIVARAEHVWEKTFDSMPDLIAILDTKHRIVKINKAMARALGADPKACIGLNCFKCVHDTKMPPPFCPHALTLKDGCEHMVEIHEGRLGGDFMVSTTPIFDHNGKVTGSIHVARDITLRKQMEDALRQNERRLNRAQEIAKLGSWELDLINNKLTWSDEVYRIFGLKPQEFEATYEAFLEAIHPDDREAVNSAYTESIANGRDTYEIDHRIVRKDTGEVRFVREKCEHFKNKKGDIFLSVGMVQDITERKLIEDRVAHLASFPELNPQPVLELNSDGKIAFFNPAAAKIADEFAEGDISVFLPQDVEEIVQELRSMRRDNMSKTIYREVEVGERIFGIDFFLSKKINAIRLYAKDITVSKHMEMEKNNFIAMMSHELRNPLASIMMGAELMRANLKNATLGSDADKDLDESLEVVEEQSKNMAHLLDDLLDISRISRGKIELKKQEVILADCVRRAIHTVQPLMRDQKHDLSMIVPEEPIYIHADPVRLEQIMVNLLNNAAKYTPPGGRVDLEVKRDGDEVEIIVSDTGIGIDPSLIDSVFNLFLRLASPFISTQGELGIGLKLTRDLVTMHSGTISAESQGKDRGSKFIVRLPILSRVKVVSDDEPEEALLPSADEERLRVMVVDDNKNIADMVAKTMNYLGHEAKACYDGSSAVNLFKDYLPQVAFIDIGMPGMNGYELARALREMEEEVGHQIKLVAVTGYGQDEDKQKSQLAGFDLHLVKPVDMNTLKQALAVL